MCNTSSGRPYCLAYQLIHQPQFLSEFNYSPRGLANQFRTISFRARALNTCAVAQGQGRNSAERLYTFELNRESAASPSAALPCAAPRFCRYLCSAFTLTFILKQRKKLRSIIQKSPQAVASLLLFHPHLIFADIVKTHSFFHRDFFFGTMRGWNANSKNYRFQSISILYRLLKYNYQQNFSRPIPNFSIGPWTVHGTFTSVHRLYL